MNARTAPGRRIFRFGRCRVLLLGLAGMVLCQDVSGHGSVTDEVDQCLISIGFYQAHFTVFQPRERGHDQFCEDLPGTGESVFVIDYLHQSLRQVPVDFRIVHDRRGVGRFARYEDVLDLDLEADTVFYQAPLVEPDAVFTVIHDFAEPGRYIGVVSAGHPTEDLIFRAVFAFEVGGFPWRYLAVLLAGLALAGGLFWRFRSVLLLGLFGAGVGIAGAPQADTPLVASEKAIYRASFQSEQQPLPLNTMHRWTLKLETAEGEPVEAAVLRLNGAMPAHDHGLPSAPQVTRELGGGRYLAEGMKFHMNGEWIIVLDIQHPLGDDRVRFEVSL